MDLLPREILSEIFQSLAVDDLLNVSLVCRAFNDASSPLLYAVLYLTWEDIDRIAERAADNKAESPSYDHRVRYARRVCIAPNGRGEWVSSTKLSVLMVASKFRLRELHITCALHSSGWLKYVSAPLISLTRLRLTNNGSSQNYAFDFAHIADTMPNIEAIELGDVHGGFLIDPFADSGLKRLKFIRVENCEWQYPSMLVDAAANGVLEKLEIHLTQQLHPFAFSERLRAECSNLPSSLESIKIIVSVGQSLNWNPLQRAKPLVNLKRAEFRGFGFKYSPRLKSDSASRFPKLKELIED